MSLLSLPGHLSFYLYTGNADMRRSFEGLCGIVRNEMGRNPLDHQVYIFINRRSTHIKLLLWEGDGFGIYHKRLEAGTFERPEALEDGRFVITRVQMQMILHGVKLKSVHYRKRYQGRDFIKKK